MKTCKKCSTVWTNEEEFPDCPTCEESIITYYGNDEQLWAYLDIEALPAIEASIALDAGMLHTEAIPRTFALDELRRNFEAWVTARRVKFMVERRRLEAEAIKEQEPIEDTGETHE